MPDTPSWTGTSRFAACIAASFLFVKLVDLLRRPSCVDCFRRHGWPSPYYREGGFAGGALWLPGGLIVDTLVVLVLASAAFCLVTIFRPSTRTD